MTPALATTRSDVADYVDVLVYVYSLLIIAHIVISMLRSFGVRIPYAVWSDAVLRFLHEVSEPYLRVFRRFIPPLGGLDLSPILALFVLRLAGGLLAATIRD